MKIFVIDDEPFMQKMIEDFLKTKFPSDELLLFSTGESALQQVDEKPGVIILDYNLNTKEAKAHNGVEILKELKKRLPNTPVIMLTANDHPSVAIDTVKFGAYDFVVKNDNAFHRLQNLLNNIHGHNSLQKQFGFQRVVNIALLLLLAVVIIAVLTILF